MRHTLRGYIKNWFNNFHIFELGNSMVFYYLVIFYLRPLLVLLGLSLVRLRVSPFHINYLAMGYITLGFIFFIFGYYNNFFTFFIRRVPNILRRDWDFSRTLYAFGVLFASGLMIKLFRFYEGAYSSGNRSSFFISNPLSGFFSFLDWSGLIALAIAFISYYQLKKNNDARYVLWRALAWGSFAVEILYGLPSCIRMNVIVPILLYLLVRSFFVKIDYKMIVLWGLGIVLFLFPLGNVCRHPGIIKVYNSSVQENTSSPYNAAARTTFFGASLIVESFLSRIDQSNVFTGIIEHPQPLWYGKPLLNFFVSLGPPRFIWKNKPVITANGNEFGRRIGVLAPDNYGTFVGSTFVGDWYMNFGILGIIAGMFFIGALFRFIFDYLIRRTGASLSGLLVYAIVWIQLLKGFEDSLAPVFAGLVKVLVLLFAVALFLQGDFARIWHGVRKQIIM